MMKRVSVAILLLMVMVPAVLAQTHFNPVDPTGIWSTIIIDDALWDDVTLIQGDEIGVFDGELCVGAIEVTADQTWPVSINAIGADGGNALPGYTTNNPMSFRLWNNTDELERTAIVSYTTGNGRFGYSPYTRISTLVVSTTGVVFGLQLPVDNGVEEQVTVELMWDAATPLEPATSLTYDIYVSTEEFDSADVADDVVAPWTTGLAQEETSIDWEGTDDTEYWWTVVAEDNFGNRSQASEIRQFEIYVPETPNSFNLLTPEQPATVADYDTVLTWEATTDPDPGDELSYWVWWATNGSFTLNLDSAEVMGTSYDMTHLLDDQTYHWKVRAQDTNTEGTWSNQTWQFDVYVIEPPDPFSLISPLSATDTCWTGDTTLTWNATTEPDPDDQVNSYMIWYATNSVFTQNLDSVEVFEGTSWDLTHLLDDRTYYWKVRAKDGNTNGTWSTNVGQFHTYIPDAPAAFALSSPANGDTSFTDTQTVTWTASSDADPNGWFYYEVQWGTSADFSDYESYTTSSIQYTIEDISQALLDNGLDELPQDITIYWRVKAQDHLGLVTWATPETGWNFRVYFIEPPAAFDLIGPLSDGGMDTCWTGDTTLVWNATTEPDPDDQLEGYRVWWATDANYTTNLDSALVTTGTTYAMSHLLDDHTYYWKVRAVDNNTNGTWANQEGMFHVYVPEAPGSFILLSPFDGDTSFVDTQEVEWSAAVDPDPNNAFVYELQWSVESDFENYWSYETTETSYLIEDISAVLLNNGLDELPQDTTIYWRVKATDTFDLTTWALPADGWEFRVYFIDPPESFSLISPADESTCWTGDTTLVWHTAAEIDPDDAVHSYVVKYATDANFGQNLETVIVDAPDTSLAITGLFDDRTYYWKVRARDNNTMEGTWSNEVWTFDVYIPETPANFALTSPENEAHVTTGDSIRLWWDEAVDPDPDDVVFYEVEWSLNADFSGEDTWSWVTQATTYRIDGLRPDFDDETLYWRVHCWDEFGFEVWSDAGETGWSFTVHVAENPEPFGLTNPADMATVTESPVTFEWAEAVEPDPGDSIIYYLYIAMDENFTEAIILETETMDYAVEGLEDDTQYWWKVHATDTNTGGTWSNEVWTFNTAFPQPPTPFGLLTPGYGDTLSLEDADSTVFSWLESMDPDPGQMVHYMGAMTISGDDYHGNPQEFTLAVDSLMEAGFVVNVPDTTEARFWWLDYITCTWTIWAVSDGDTVMCDSSFYFYVEPQTSARENPFSGLPTEYSVAAVYPNPFNPTTTVVVGLPEAAPLRVMVYNMLGQQVAVLADDTFNAGFHRVVFNAGDLSSGLYFVRAVTPGKMNQMRKVLLVK